MVSRAEFSGRAAVPRVLDVLEREGAIATFLVPGITVDAWSICAGGSSTEVPGSHIAASTTSRL